jgi:chromate reductase
MLQVLGIAGSLRAGSYNRALLAAAVELAPATMTLTVASIRELPLYDGDVEAAGVPPAVAALKESVQAADALLVVTPEYNYSVPGVLKNAIDWISRGPVRVLTRKPVAIMGASDGRYGTVRAQLHLRQVATGVGCHVMVRPEVHVTQASEKFDAQGRLTDAPTRKAVAALLEGLESWAEMHRQRS